MRKFWITIRSPNCWRIWRTVSRFACPMFHMTPVNSFSGPIPATAPPPSKLPPGPISSKPVSDIKVTPVPKGVPAEQAITGSRSETRVKMNRMRQRIAQRLKDAQNTYAMLTTFNEIDMRCFTSFVIFMIQIEYLSGKAILLELQFSLNLKSTDYCLSLVSRFARCVSYLLSLW